MRQYQIGASQRGCASFVTLLRLVRRNVVELLSDARKKEEIFFPLFLENFGRCCVTVWRIHLERDFALPMIILYYGSFCEFHTTVFGRYGTVVWPPEGSSVPKLENLESKERVILPHCSFTCLCKCATDNLLHTSVHVSVVIMTARVRMSLTPWRVISWRLLPENVR